MIFPEASQETTGHSLQVTVVSTARTLEEARRLYESLGFFFQSAEDEQERAARKPRSRQQYKRK